MPIYEYRCGSCGFQKDHLQKLSDPVLTACPECGKESYVKMLSAAGFQLKGSGWYATDFKGGSNAGTKAKTETESKPGEAAGSAASSTPPSQGCGGGCACAGS